MSIQTHKFSIEDLDILSRGVSIVPNLQLACRAAKLAHKQVSFPITGIEAITQLLSMLDAPAGAARPADLQAALPAGCFPITDADDLLGKLLGALSWAEVVAEHERFLADPAQASPVRYGTPRLLDVSRRLVPLSVPGQWVALEELWNGGVSVYRHLEVPDGVQVRFRHNFNWPPFVWEVTLNGPSTNGFYIPLGWNKLQVRLDSPRATTVAWILG
jgi:hypothetical protein